MKVILLTLILLTGCSSVPVKPIFPEPIEDIMIACPDLYLVPEDTIKLSETLLSVTKNYGLYHQCSAKVNTWIKWYVEQKKIYNEIK